MASKTWKLGEVCRGGIIQVKTKGNNVTIIGKDWDYSQGTRRGSDQSNAKEWTRLEVDAEQRDADRQMSMFLNDLTTSYHTDKIMEWIESKTDLTKRLFW
jgi:hypothetical protein